MDATTSNEQMCSSSSALSSSSSSSSYSGWYPCPPPSNIPVSKAINDDITPVPCEPVDHPIWQKIKYTSQNFWAPSISRERKEKARRMRIPGVEVRDLPPNHFLHGEQGLYATKKFEKFDVIGEYTGRIVGNDVLFGHYLAALEDCPQEEGLGVDAQTCGNEIRFINSYINVAFCANVTLRTVYMNTYPHLLVVCTQDIEIGDEILLDYGKAYNELYLTPKQAVETPPIANDIILEELPKLDLDSDTDEPIGEH